MQIAVMLFEGFAALDAVGPYDALARVPGAHVIFAAERVGPVSSESGRLALVADAVLSEIPHPDVLVVPGGSGRRRHMSNGPLHQWMRGADATSRWTIGVGEGTLLLAAAGPLHGRRAASKPGALSLELVGHGAIPVGDMFTFDGKYATAADGSAALGLGVELARRIRAAVPQDHERIGIR